MRETLRSLKVYKVREMNKVVDALYARFLELDNKVKLTKKETKEKQEIISSAKTLKKQYEQLCNKKSSKLFIMAHYKG